MPGHARRANRLWLDDGGWPCRLDERRYRRGRERCRNRDYAGRTIAGGIHIVIGVAPGPTRHCKGRPTRDQQQSTAEKHPAGIVHAAGTGRLDGRRRDWRGSDRLHRGYAGRCRVRDDRRGRWCDRCRRVDPRSNGLTNFFDGRRGCDVGPFRASSSSRCLCRAARGHYKFRQWRRSGWKTLYGLCRRLRRQSLCGCSRRGCLWLGRRNARAGVAWCFGQGDLRQHGGG